MTTSLFLDDICTLGGERTDWKGSQSNSDDVDKKTLPKKFKPANQKLTCRPPRPDLAFRLKSRPPWPPEQEQQQNYQEPVLYAVSAHNVQAIYFRVIGNSYMCHPE